MTAGLLAASVGKHMRAMRALKGLSLRSHAKEIGISAATLSRVERGYNCDLATLETICESTGVQIDVLLGIRKGPK